LHALVPLTAVHDHDKVHEWLVADVTGRYAKCAFAFDAFIKYNPECDRWSEKRKGLPFG
jgi:hypothetical protein